MNYLSLTLKGHHMVNLSTNTNPLTNCVVVVARHMCHDCLACAQSQGVQKL